MTTVSKTIAFDAAHMLSGYSGKCRNLHGHTYRLEVDVRGEPDESGMVLDFFELKKCMNEAADRFDHAFLYDERSETERELASFLEKRGLKTVSLPFRTTSENLARHFFELFRNRFEVSAVRVRETPTSCAEFKI